MVFCSPMQRARMTCALAGFEQGIEVDSDLMEWDYGRYEGLTTADIRVDHPGWNAFLDGCPGGEHVADVGRRADRVIARLLGVATHPIVIFSHAHFLRVLAARWVQQDPVEGRHLVLNTCSISSLGYEREERAITSWNT
jgi:probable phosphoglycerate mutase